MLTMQAGQSTKRSKARSSLEQRDSWTPSNRIAKGKQVDVAVFVRDRRHSGKIMTAELQVTVKVNSALKHSLGQHINMEGSRETAFIEVARVAGRDEVNPTATLAPRSDKPAGLAKTMETAGSHRAADPRNH